MRMRGRSRLTPIFIFYESIANLEVFLAGSGYLLVSVDRM